MQKFSLFTGDLSTSKELNSNFGDFHYRMSPKTFNYHCETAFMHMAKEHTHLQETIPVCNQIVLYEYNLATVVNSGSPTVACALPEANRKKYCQC